MPTKATLCLVLICGTAASSTSAQAQNAPVNEQIHSEIRNIGGAEVRSVSGGVFDPAHQPEVYWHDSDWKIDLVIPPNPPNEKIPYSLNIRSSTGESETISLDSDLAQIDSIHRSPDNMAIVIGDMNGDTKEFSVVDLKLGKVIISSAIYDPSVSPNGRFLLFDAWYPPRSEYAENQYTLYDTLKTFSQNLCGYWDKNPKYRSRNDHGILVYPPKVGCKNEDDTDDNIGSSFTWSPDSSKVVFADVKSGVMSLILVTMPIGANDLPKTSTYPLVGAENVCAGATDASGQPNCDYHVIQSLGWDGDTVTAVFNHRFGTKLNLTMAIPVSRFTLIGK